ncbi:hypothetical protein CSW98_00590 [Vibrio sp. HA2012]|uniref:porin n=1 Tax=Vibrio sp. HA2012 TaxID=1971595 RepID=UPI000C2C57C7|nr:porin [Vibrio sp. HA2012]PJC87659.1 hypothetical protein CSW98_00590 [Vibrio sp. HA2012]
MKKTLIALSVLVAAGSVNAATTVYENDGVKVGVHGEIAIHYEQAEGTDKDAAIIIDDADFGFDAESAINEDMAVIASIDVKGGEDAADNETFTYDDVWVGVKTGAVTAKVGKQVTLIDDFGLSNDQAFGLKTAEDLAEDAFTAKETEVVRVNYDSGEMFYGAFDVVLKSNGTDEQTSAAAAAAADEDATQYDLMAGVRFGDADIALTYSDSNEIAGDDTDGTFIGVKGAYTLGDVVLSAVYTNADVEDLDITSYGANIQYTMDKFGFNFGMVNSDLNDEAEAYAVANGKAYNEDYSEYYANVTYAVAKNATVFFEVQDSDVEDMDMGYAAGLKVKF